MSNFANIFANNNQQGNNAQPNSGTVNIFGQTQTTGNPTPNLFQQQLANMGKDPNSNVFNNMQQQQPQQQNTMFGQTQNMYSNPQQQQQGNPNIFSNPQNNNQFQQQQGQQQTAGGNLFTNLGTQGQQQTINNPFAQQPQLGSTAPAGNIFPSQTTGNNLFSQPAGGTGAGMFPQGQGTTGTNNLFNQQSTAFFPNTYGQTGTVQYGTQQPQPQQQLGYDPGTLTNFRKGNLVSVVDTTRISLSDSNSLKNVSISQFSPEIVKKYLVPIQKSINDAERNISTINSRNTELAGLMETYNGIMRDRLTLTKRIFFEFVQKTTLVAELKSTLDGFEKLANGEFDSYYQSLASGGNRYSLIVLSPSEFEMQLSNYVLKKARELLYQLTDYGGCQDSTDAVSYIEVVPFLIEYYKNVACLMNEFRDKYSKFREEVIRRSRGSSVDLESRLESTTRNIEAYNRILEVEKQLRQKIQHTTEAKNRYTRA